VDRRERVVHAVEAGASRRATAAKFEVSPSFVIKLMQRWRRHGTLRPERIGGRKRAKLAAHTESRAGVAGDRARPDDRRAARPAGHPRYHHQPLGARPVPDRRGPDTKKRPSTPPSRTARTSPPPAAPGARGSPS
jgi:hypothetical protein